MKFVQHKSSIKKEVRDAYFFFTFISFLTHTSTDYQYNKYT